MTKQIDALVRACSPAAVQVQIHQRVVYMQVRMFARERSISTSIFI